MQKSILVLAITAALMTASALPAQAQEPRRELTDAEYEQMGRDRARIENYDKDQKRRDADNMSDLRDDRKETKAIATEARRVERDANTAARESRHAYRMERKAQKQRAQADKQALKATKARNRSNAND